ncbi:hypothetical protein GALMADRAFT_132545 [Galerina marginata CBS 339.88]|uniref:TPX2 C-terminal domain-containing protein n=1 Tax=Galerina marginata (strain CBS 339.88) TaxID=685588 RepID=A0A067TU99_GALM3|nr:hypothetical protein GALMADRAFT_132545 [Galerina marginata CBS 339.88]
MPQRNSGDELSLRHLPDMSDTSFSFQIPGSVPEENLLDEGDLDFFKGGDLSAVPTIVPSTSHNEPLSLSQLTPRPTAQKQALQSTHIPTSFPTLSYEYVNDGIPDSKHEKPTSRVQRPKLSKITTEGISKSRPKLITPSIPHISLSQGSPAGARLEALSAEVDSLDEDGPIRGSYAHQELKSTETHQPKGIRRTSLEKKRLLLIPEKREKHTRSKQKVIQGGITKTKIISKPTDKASHSGGAISPRIAISVFSPAQHATLCKVLDGDEISLADTTTTSLTAGGGAAARLVQYSQKLITSFGGLNSEAPADVNVSSVEAQADAQEDLETGTDASLTRPGTADGTDRPLTLSQLSPRKSPCRPPTPTPPANAPMSPLRPPTKRPVSVASEIHHHKKSKTDASTTGAASNGSETSSSGQPHNTSTSVRKYPKPNVFDSISIKPTGRGIGRARGNAITRQAPVFKPGSNDDVRHASRSTSTSNPSSSRTKLRVSRQDDNDTIKAENRASTLRGTSKPSSSSLSRSSTSAKPASLFLSYFCAVVHALPHATRPVEFKLLTDSRLETRKGEHGKEPTNSQSRSRSQREAKPIPDFKALHAAQEAELAHRKENVHPTVPLSIKWETDHRLKERQKFDEKVREKEREQERLMEERRREREEQEAKELRELRKKAIPKAHEVPEWYKEAPKKKDKTIGGIGG